MQTNPYQNLWGKNKIGKDVKIGAYTEIGNSIIGDNCIIGAYCFICPTTVIEDNVFIGPGVMILNDKYPPSYGKHWKPVTIKKGAVIGGRSLILPGVVIGEKSIIGAGSIVTKSVPDGEVWYGPSATRRVNNG